MELVEFIQIIETSLVISENRKKDFIEKAPFMTSGERKYLVNEVEQSTQQYQKTLQTEAELLREYETALQDFEHTVIPQTIKNIENTEREEELKAAEKLLDNEIET